MREKGRHPGTNEAVHCSVIATPEVPFKAAFGRPRVYV